MNEPKRVWNHTPQAHAVFVAAWVWLALWSPVMLYLMRHPDWTASHFTAAWQVVACLVALPFLTMPVILAITWRKYAHPARK